MALGLETRILLDRLRAAAGRPDPVAIPFEPQQPRGSRVFVVGTHRLAGSRHDAAKTIRLGLVRAFHGLGHSTHLVDARGLEKFAAEGALGGDDVVIAASTDLMYVPRALRRVLASTRLLVWVNPWFTGQVAFLRRHSFPPEIGTGRLQVATVDSCSPTALFTTYPECAFDFYSGWIDRFGSLRSIPHAFDHHFYDRTAGKHRPDLENRVVFVGGYWPYKGRAFHKYLVPFADELVTYGYSSWPFGDYRGKLPTDDEAAVLRSAAVVPGVNEPHAEVLGGEVCERVFKVAGVGGLCVADLCPGYRELFRDDELLMPRTHDEYVQLVRDVLAERVDAAAYRDAGRRAVFERHLYEHRAQALLEAAGLNGGAPRRSNPSTTARPSA